MYLRINSPNVVREFFDGEVVVVNLESGTYYSLEKLAATVWLLFEQELAADAIFKLLAEHYQTEIGTLRQTFEPFVAQLIEEKLVLAQENGTTGAAGENVLAILSSSAPTFSEPVLRKYNDMQDLLLLDPIHDVDDAGWPATKQANER